eukprot:CAMPEP_0116121194 /NCGR_PEP_ID=MMETSP0329-20121206/3569_1 /TAXON_ID=697910 /ORGANISM="Pseudo-nitzschia arenysensis, Strain B593" /LENGTH=266 /DNA_ID=CAMNT_0003614995 /DNA_START=689 /DNA_END=1489 /DNA_ORIENTATION=-
MNMATQQPKRTQNSKSWDNRTRFVVYGQGFLFIVAWTVALGRLVGEKFWNAELNSEKLNALLLVESKEVPEGVVYFIKYFFLSYYNKRFVFFLPHVLGAIVWWGLYYLQLIPSIRQKYKKFHRILGRILMVSAISQTISGVGLAYMGKSPTVKLVSYLAAISVLYCVYNAWYFAAIKDISKHQYWAVRLVGYLQTVALQRVVVGILLLSYRFGCLGLYPAFDEEDGETLVQIFDDSFVSSFLVVTMVTEWYLAGCYGWTEIKKPKT